MVALPGGPWGTLWYWGLKPGAPACRPGVPAFCEPSSSLTWNSLMNIIFLENNFIYLRPFKDVLEYYYFPKTDDLLIIFLNLSRERFTKKEQICKVIHRNLWMRMNIVF